MIETKTELEISHITEEHIQKAKKIWEYLGYNHGERDESDVAVVLGSAQVDLTAGRVADLYFQGKFPWIVCTGGNTGITKDWSHPESIVAVKKLMTRGIPINNILWEWTSTNIGQNFLHAKEKLAEVGLLPKKVLIVTHHAASTRAILTARKQWQGPKEFQVAYPEDEFINGHLSYRFSLVLGEVDRLIKYQLEDFDFIEPIQIPSFVLQLREELYKDGFNGRIKS